MTSNEMLSEALSFGGEGQGEGVEEGEFVISNLELINFREKDEKSIQILQIKEVLIFEEFSSGTSILNIRFGSRCENYST